MPLHLITSDATIKAIRKGDPRLRLTDGGGLYLLLFLNGGSHAWRLDYTFQARRKTLSLGTYPATTLANARRKAEAAREAVAQELDPSAERKEERAGHLKAKVAEMRRKQGLPDADSFEAVAREWFDVKKDGWAKSYGDKIIARLQVDVFPYIGHDAIDDIPPMKLLEVIRRIEKRGVIETAHRALENCSQVFTGAPTTGSSKPAW